MDLKEYIVSRNLEIKSLKENLEKGSPILISGDRGVGKTTLLMLYHKQFEKDYPNIISLNLSRLSSYESFLANVFNQLKKYGSSNNLGEIKNSSLTALFN